MTTPQATTKTKPVDIMTINGLLEILANNINSINADSSDENIKKSNAILQNVNAIKGIYNLAFDRERLANLGSMHSDYLSGSYHKPSDLLGSVMGDDTERVERERLAEQASRQRNYEWAINKLQTEIDNNQENKDTDQADYNYESFSKDEIKIFNKVLGNAPENTDFSTEYKKDVYLLENLKPSDFGVEE